MEKVGDITVFQDINEAWAKMTRELDKFVTNVCGKDLSEAANKHADTVYTREIKTAIQKKDSQVESEWQGIESHNWAVEADIHRN